MAFEHDSRPVDPARMWASILGLTAMIPVVLVGLGLARGYWSSGELGMLAVYSVALAVAGLYWLYYGFQRRRAVEDVPTSRIGAAAQGYVEVSGEAFRLPDVEPIFTANGLPCLWFRTIAGDGAGPESGIDGTHKPFGIRDQTGAAIVFPHGALVQPVNRHRWRGNDGTAYVEDRIFQGDRLYVLGDFGTGEPKFEFEAEVAEKLRRWRGAGAARFDANRDGKLDSAEDWAMRMQAVREAEREEREVLAGHRPVNLLSRPADGRSFVISTRSQASLRARFRGWEIAGIAAFLVGTWGAAWCGLRLGITS
jgi:hypothetical protein